MKQRGVVYVGDRAFWQWARQEWLAASWARDRPDERPRAARACPHRHPGRPPSRARLGRGLCRQARAARSRDGQSARGPAVGARAGRHPAPAGDRRPDGAGDGRSRQRDDQEGEVAVTWFLITVLAVVVFLALLAVLVLASLVVEDDQAVERARIEMEVRQAEHRL